MDSLLITIPRQYEGKRFGQALAIQQGASNPIAVSRALVAAIYEISDKGTGTINTDPAVRLICHQLAFLLGVSSLNNDLSDYDRTMAACMDGDTAVRAATLALASSPVNA
jgi:hypothetical protein